MKKKVYIAPELVTLDMNISTTILAGSNGSISSNGDNIEIDGFGDSSSGWADGRESDFDFDE